MTPRLLLVALAVAAVHAGNPDAKRLYDDLLSNYNKIVRPVVNNSDVLTVRIKLKLSQLIDLVSGVSNLAVGVGRAGGVGAETRYLALSRDAGPDNEAAPSGAVQHAASVLPRADRWRAF